jgi:two-component system, OmpR family, response regulator
VAGEIQPQIPRRILFADDEEQLHELIRRLFEPRGFEVDCVSDGEKALQAFRENDYAVMLVDLMMPGLNGFELLREIKAVDADFLERVIVVTAASRDTWEWFDRASVGAFMRKPIDVNRLVEVVERFAAGEFAKGEESSD